MSTIKQLLNKNLTTTVDNMERDLMFKVITNMRAMEITMERAQRLAQDLLSQYPMEDMGQVVRAFQLLGVRYPEAQEIYIKYANEYFKRKAFHTQKKAFSHLKKGEIKRAVITAKGGNSYD